MRARKLAIGALGLAVLITLGLIVLGALSSSRLEEELARIRAAGGTLDLEELRPPEIPDDENAAGPLGRAFELLGDSAIARNGPSRRTVRL